MSFDSIITRFFILHEFVSQYLNIFDRNLHFLCQKLQFCILSKPDRNHSKLTVCSIDKPMFYADEILIPA